MFTSHANDFISLVGVVQNVTPNMWMNLYLACIVICALMMIRYLRAQYLALSAQHIFLEVVPLQNGDVPPSEVVQFFSVIHEYCQSQSFVDRLAGANRAITAEIVSTRTSGIRYLLRVNSNDKEVVERYIATYLPHATVSVVQDPLSAHLKLDDVNIQHLVLAQHFSHPIKVGTQGEQNKLASYITGSMTKLAPGEMIAYQMIIAPTTSRKSRVIKRRIHQGKNLHISLRERNTLLRLIYHTLILPFTVLTRIVSMPFGLFLPSSRRSYNESRLALDRDLLVAMYDKLSGPLYEASLRTMVVSSKKTTKSDRSKELSSSFASYATNGQTIRVRLKLPTPLGALIRRYMFVHRIRPILKRNRAIFSLVEMANLYYFNGRLHSTENRAVLLSKSLPAPTPLKNKDPTSLVIGVNKHHGCETLLSITEEERQRHVLIVGGTGNGKTTMMQYMAMQDINNGKGVAVIDPHGDFAEYLLAHIPKSRVKDVVYINPDDLSFPVGINLLEIPQGLEEDEMLREKDLITESVISVLRKVFSDDNTGGHRIEYILRNTIQTALTLPNPTIFTVLRLLNNASYRLQVAWNIEDQDLKDFWDNELGKAGDFQRVKMSAGITNKLGRFRHSTAAKRMLSQPKSTINFDDVINSGKILICNFSKGKLGEDTSTLFGTTVLAKLQMATTRRARKAVSKRKDYYLYVDEFQNFSSQSFLQMLSEARKYRLFLTIAEQSTSQQEKRQMVNVILANVGTVVCFRTASPDDEACMLPVFQPYIKKNEITNLPAFHFFVRIAAIQPHEPTSGVTLLGESASSKKVMRNVIESSRKLYSGDGWKVEKFMVKPLSEKSSIQHMDAAGVQLLS